MTIGELLEQLRGMIGSAIVTFDFCNCAPTEVDSWRGDYAKPALGWSPTGYSGNRNPPTVADLIRELEKATSGKIFRGWKGGEYTYGLQDRLWIDNRGDSTRTVPVHVQDECLHVIIITRKERA